MRNNYFDVLKALAIIAVVLYHLGTCEYGYLGVDIFLVIAGYFTSKSIDKQIVIGGGYLPYVSNRLFRLWPLLLIAGIVIFAWGWMLMLPDDYENMAQSVIATNFFGNNVLQSITTKNYWDVVNEYKPLMHTWYVGLLMQFYVVVPLILFSVGRMITNTDKRSKTFSWVMSLLGLASLFLYLTSSDNAQKFYYLPFRLYEFSAGALVFYLFDKYKTKPLNGMKWNLVFILAYLVVILLLFANADIFSKVARLLMTVGLTALLMALMPRVRVASGNLLSNKWIASIGAASFSIFVWHQVVFALTRYSFTSKLTDLIPLLSVMLLTALLSALSYRYVEKMKQTRRAWMIAAILLVLTTGYSLYVYSQAGVMRDVPELDVVKGKVHRGMWAEYCDRGYKYDKEFTVSDKPKWYVIGNSFGRDFVNIIAESAIADSVEVVYSDTETYKEKHDRFAKADVVFLSSLGVNEELINEVRALCPEKCKFYIIGEKNFGENNGQIYRHRFDKDYHEMTIRMEQGYAEKNEWLKALYPDSYVDMIAKVQYPDGSVRVFSDDGRFISQDCRHLTKAGAQYYAKLMDWSIFLGEMFASFPSRL